MIRQTHSVDIHIPVRSEGPADSEEQKHAHCGKQSDARYESVHPTNHMLGVHNAEEKQANRDFHECESDESLDPVGPADHLEQSSLCRRQVVLMSSQSVQNLRGNESRAD